MPETVSIAVPVRSDTELANYRAEAIDVRAEMERLAIATEAEMNAATDRLAAVVEIVKAADRRRLEATKPLRDKVDAINGMFKEVVGPLEEAVEIAKTKIKLALRDINAAKERARRDAEADAARARAAEEERRRAERPPTEPEPARPPVMPAPSTSGPQRIGSLIGPAMPPAPVNAPPMILPSAPSTTIRAESGASAHIRKVWTWQLLDIAAVPAAYLAEPAVDTTAVDLAVESGVREIPGIAIFEDDVLAVRSRRPRSER